MTCYTTRCKNDQWIAYLFTTRCWSLWQRVVIGQCLQRVVRKLLRAAVYASTSTTASIADFTNYTPLTINVGGVYAVPVSVSAMTINLKVNDSWNKKEDPKTSETTGNSSFETCRDVEWTYRTFFGNEFRRALALERIHLGTFSIMTK